jgi:hypothetical protein
MKRPGFVGIILAAILLTVSCGGGGDKKENASATSTAPPELVSTTVTTAETTTTTAAATTTTAAAAASGQPLKDGFTVVSGTSLYQGPEDQKENTVGNAVYSGWKASLDLTGDLDAVADAYIAQVNKNGYTLLPEDKGENTSEGRKIRYRSFTGVKEVPDSRAVGGKRTTDQVVINVIKSDSGSGQVTINVEHIRRTD